MLAAMAEPMARPDKRADPADKVKPEDPEGVGAMSSSPSTVGCNLGQQVRSSFNLRWVVRSELADRRVTVVQAALAVLARLEQPTAAVQMELEMARKAIPDHWARTGILDPTVTSTF